MREVDVIVPIYNALGEVRKCVDSIIANTGGEFWRLVLIDDMSPDPQVPAYLNALDDRRIVRLRNVQNMGYLKTCNVGLEHAGDRDAVLLNSDTEVTAGWLDKLRHCAYLEENVALVSPLTNVGMICSVPEFMVDNDLPRHMTLEAYATLIERISLKQYPTVPSVFGFCMYIRRDAAQTIGYLDEIFGMGYYEENDYSFRARKAGFINKLCDDTFIYHKGSSSIGAQKFDISERNRKIVEERYPSYMRELHRFYQEDPIIDIQENIRRHLTFFNTARPNVLMLIHANPFPDAEHVRGGSEYLVHDIISQTRSVNALVLYPDHKEYGTYHLRGELDSEETIKLTFSVYKAPKDQLKDGNMERLYREIISSCNISAVHVHHFLNHSLDIMDACEASGIRVSISVHDFYAICPTFTFLDERTSYCSAGHERKPAEHCSDHCPQLTCQQPAYVEHWRNQMGAALAKADTIYVPSNYVKAAFNLYFPLLDVQVRPHGIMKHATAMESKREADGPFRVAFIGALSGHKGARTIEAMIRLNRRPNVVWYLIGAIGEQYIDNIKSSQVVKIGEYDRQNIQGILKENGIDLVCLPSICPETYSFTLSEAVSAGIPVIVSSLGALKERTLDGAFGWVVDDFLNAEAYLQTLYHAMDDARDYAGKKEAAQHAVLPGIPDVADRYEADYLHMVRQAEKTYPNLGSDIFRKSNENGMREALAHITGLLEDQIRNYYFGRFYLDTGKGFNESENVPVILKLKPDFSISAEIPVASIHNLRWDPIEGMPCRVRVQEIKYRKDNQWLQQVVSKCSHNGVQDGDDWLFAHIDPSIVLNIGGHIDRIVIAGQWSPGVSAVSGQFIQTPPSPESIFKKILRKVRNAVRRLFT